ncbi:hypothetical protein [Marinimicrobium alkaliphilum]|uniref:hypothetical protein n=1 Tax=Marinimicrobium alkaliphilum TaxID=2202654 RepID=UPI0018E09B03|nr:hypothetical protein [Marinimicrobium alkaliphilum]
MTDTAMNTETDSADPRRGYRARRRLLVGLLLLLGGLLFWEGLGRGPVSWLFPPMIQVTLDGQNYRVPEAELQRILQDNPANHPDFIEQQLAALDEELAGSINALYDAAQARIPDYLDWHYSVRGNVTRATLWGVSRLGIGERDYPDAVYRERLLGGDDHWEQQVAGLVDQVEEGYRAVARDYASESRHWIETQLAPFRQDAPDTDASVTLDLNRALLFEGDMFEFQAAAHRAFVSGGASFLVSAGVAQRLMAARATRAAAVRVGAAGASRTAARAGSRGIGAAAATPCLATGPAAAVCVGTVFVATIAITEVALIYADEVLNRDEYEQALLAELQRLRKQTLAQAAEASAAVRVAHAQVPEEFERRIRPVDLL